MTTATKKAIVLLSGGLDSATVLAIAKDEGFACFALSFRYGQRHVVELIAAERLAAQFGAAQHAVIDIDLRRFGGSALTSDLPVPKDRPLGTVAAAIPSTYVPARNTIFLSYALAWAEVLEVHDVFIGVNALDYSGYPDCRPEYIAAFARLANLATRAAVEGRQAFIVHTPLIHLTKAQIIREGLRLGVDYAQTITCYDPAPDGRACGHCDACLLRRKGFADNGLCDPAPYR
ncbi:MAG TPA: 7-cyano-7-deazaguanine synthase QueC [Chloroflexota bacterium]|nr:7-cyano-7-deazaguanine synthase QueC [Chloroflexota bacterium]